MVSIVDRVLFLFCVNRPNLFNLFWLIFSYLQQTSLILAGLGVAGAALAGWLRSHFMLVRRDARYRDTLQPLKASSFIHRSLCYASNKEGEF